MPCPKSWRHEVSRAGDLRKLDVLLSTDSLDEWEKEAFESMRQRLEKKGAALTDRQRQKVDGAWERLELDAEDGAKNLWSSGKVPAGKSIRLPYEDMPRPLKPPGRS